jgi:hypothetical protein
MTMSTLLTNLQSELQSHFTDCEEVKIQEGTEFHYKSKKFRRFIMLLAPGMDTKTQMRIGRRYRTFFEVWILVLVKSGKRLGRITGSDGLTTKVSEVKDYLKINTLSDTLDPSPSSQCGDAVYLTTESDDIGAAVIPFSCFITESL